MQPVPSRVVDSYHIRFQLQQLFGDRTRPVAEGAIDLHVHAQPGTEDALDIAKSASLAKMGGVVFKNLPRDQELWETYQGVVDELSRWAEAADVEPTRCFFGVQTDPQYGGLGISHIQEAIDHGARVVWFPVLTSAHSLHRVGAPTRSIKGYESDEVVAWPLPWEEARKYGQYLIEDDEGTLKQEVRDILSLAADRGVAVSFAHSSKREMQALAEECQRIGYRQAFIDHPYGPQVGLEFEDLAPFAQAGIHFNFTFDEISPLLGIDPKVMMHAIREIGPDHFTLSSDGGNPLLPGAVDALSTLIRYARAYGMSPDEIAVMTAKNPSAVLGLS